jgi:putative Mg2+ transporter-C (MgtC) family protein
LPDMRDRLVDELEGAKYLVADVDVVEIGDDLIEIVAKLVASAVDPNELNAVAVDMQRQPGVRHATWEVSTTD